MTERTSIMVSMQVHEKMHATKAKLEKICHKPLSMNELIEILLTARPLNDILEDLILS